INVSLLNNSGLKISKIAGMSEAELSSKIVQLTSTTADANLFIDQLIICMVELEEEQFEKLLSHLIMKFGFEKAITQIIYPFLEKIGILWQTGNITPAQEHFMSNLIRQKIVVAIDSIPFPKKDADKVVLFLPENELHEIGLLFYHYIVRKMGFKTYYLGQHLPYNDLKQVCATHHPKFIISAVTISQKPHKTVEYFNDLLRDHPASKVLVSGNSASNLDIKAPNFSYFRNSDELRLLLI
ncbi:MAG: B12-binding domain-containing protein, partial [Cyclobacteriaceae bacterium]